jgi:polyhydroxyalkanoate synthesis regulator phasin
MKASTDCVRAALRYRQQQHRLVAVVSGLLNVPTRAELDDAYLEIQQLKRQMRELQRSRRPSPAKPHGRKGSTKENRA